VQQYSVILVWSSSHAIRIEHVLNQAGIASKLIPTPRQFTSDCGLSVRVKREDVEAAKTALDNAWAEYESICDLD
jgi:hypothetical protein